MKSVLALLSVLALPVMAAEPTLYGRYEYIKLPEIGETLKAKMDTGALTASLSAKNIQTFTGNRIQTMKLIHYLFSSSNFFMNATRASTPALGIAL